jgi:hypothetical protein
MELKIRIKKLELWGHGQDGKAEVIKNACQL